MADKHEIEEQRRLVREASHNLNTWSRVREQRMAKLRLLRAEHARQCAETGGDLCVTDHAVLRYLERVSGIDIQSLRDEIAGQIREGERVGFERIVCREFVAVLREDDLRVTTILDRDAPTGLQEYAP